MVESAFRWAKGKGPTKFRVNVIHGEEEARLVLTDTFELENMDKEENSRSGNWDVQVGTSTKQINLSRIETAIPFRHLTPNRSLACCQDEHGTLLETDLPGLDAGQDEERSELPSTSNVMSFKSLVLYGHWSFQYTL